MASWRKKLKGNIAIIGDRRYNFTNNWMFRTIRRSAAEICRDYNKHDYWG
jgi:hypothetical protein